jgi:hypothetical protein
LFRSSCGASAKIRFSIPFLQVILKLFLRFFKLHYWVFLAS